MSRQFIEERLFRPFASSKPNGFGIGLYQCRDWVRQWRGRLEAVSAPGAGTSMHLSLPLLDGDSPSPAAAEGQYASDLAGA